MSLRDVVHARSVLYREIRNVLYQKDFYEVVTPILSPFPDIAPVKQFQTKHPDRCKVSCLRIAPTEFLKQLLQREVSRIFEFSTNFRPDSVSRTHLQNSHRLK